MFSLGMLAILSVLLDTLLLNVVKICESIFCFSPVWTDGCELAMLGIRSDLVGEIGVSGF
jgi:hypothetical protein